MPSRAVHLQFHAISGGLAEASLSSQPGSGRKQWVRVSHSKVTRSESPDIYTRPESGMDRQHQTISQERK